MPKAAALWFCNFLFHTILQFDILGHKFQIKYNRKLLFVFHAWGVKFLWHVILWINDAAFCSSHCWYGFLQVQVGRLLISSQNYVFSTLLEACKNAGAFMKASPEGRLSGDGVVVLRFPECLLDGLLAAAPGPLACPSRGARPPSPS